MFSLKKVMRRLDVDYGDPMHEEVLEASVDLLVSAGLNCDAVDRCGQPVDDYLQATLMAAFLRAPGLMDYLQDHKVRAKTGTPYDQSISIRAFNLWEGAAFLQADHVWVIMEAKDYGDEEQVIIYCRDASRADEPNVPTRHFIFDYCDVVAVVGNCRNPTDYSDNDWGN